MTPNKDINIDNAETMVPIDNKKIVKNDVYNEKMIEPWSITIKISDDLYEDLVINSKYEIIETVE